MNYRTTGTTLLMLFFSLPLFASSHGAALHVSDAWIREAPPAAKVLAAYMVINNHGKQEITITGASSEQFGNIEIHSTKMDNGMARMVREEKLVIPAGGAVTFKPGGMHLMLFNPVKPVTQGNHVMITLTAEDGASYMVHAEVRKGGMEMMDHGNMDHSKHMMH